MSGGTAYFKAGGTMSPDAPSYIERQADADLLAALLRREYVFLLDSRQKGKSSLVARTIVKLHNQGVTTVKLDLQRVGANVTPEQWYGGLLAAIGQELGLTDQLFQYWGDHMAVGPLARWIGAIQEVVIPECQQPLVVFVDEVDFVRALPFPTDEFFAAVRDCYNRRSEGKGFESITFCLVGVATPGQLIRNPEVTPFNIGKRIDISDFTEEETAAYAAVLDAPGRKGKDLMRRVHYWLNGHPYLTQLLCSHLASEPAITSPSGVDALVHRLFLTPEARQREPNLSDVERRLLDPEIGGLSEEEQRTQVLELYGQVLKGRKVDAAEENPVVATLRLAGVGLEDHRALRLRNRLYGSVFGEKWRRNSLPDAEKRRQRGAARVALLRTASVAGVFVLGVTTIALNTGRLANERERALTNLQQKSNDLKRVSSEKDLSLKELKEKSAALTDLSEARATALSELRSKSVLLASTSRAREVAIQRLSEQRATAQRLSEERKQSINRLEEVKGTLEEQNYIGLMANLRLKLMREDWSSAMNLVVGSSHDSHRNWEWGHVAATMHEFDRSFDVPLGPKTPASWSAVWFKRGYDDTVGVHALDGEYDLTESGLRLRRATTAIGNYYFGGSGNIRCEGIDGLRAQTFIEEGTDRKLATYVGGFVFDIDPKERSFLCFTVGAASDPLEIRSVDSGEVIGRLTGHGYSVTARYLPDGTILSAQSDGTICRRDRNNKVVATVKVGRLPGDTSNQIEFNRDKTLFVYFDSQYRRLEIRKTSDLSLVTRLEGPAVLGGSVDFSKDNRRLIVGDGNGAVRLYDVQSGAVVRTYVAHGQKVFDCMFLKGDKKFLTLCRTSVKEWSVDAPAAVDVCPIGKGTVRYTHLTKDGKYMLALVERDGQWVVESKNLQTGQRWEYGTQNVAVEWGDSNVLLTDNDGTVIELAPEGLRRVRSVNIGSVRVGGNLASKSGDRLMVISFKSRSSRPDEFVTVDTRQMKVLSRAPVTWPTDMTSIDRWLIDDSGSRLLITASVMPGGRSKGVRHDWVAMVSLTEGRVLASQVMPSYVSDVKFAPGGKSLYLLHIGQVDVLESDTLKTRDSIVTPQGYSLSVDPTGKKILVWDDRGAGQVFDLATKKSLGTLSELSYVATGRGHVLEYAAMVFSPDGQRIVACLPDRPATIFSAENGRQVFTLDYKPTQASEPDTLDFAPSVSFSGDGRRLALGCADGNVRVFNSVDWKKPTQWVTQTNLAAR